MRESNEEGYRTLGWIINKSEQGLYLVVADEEIQQEIVRFYRRGAVEIFNYRNTPGTYSFRDLQEWVSRLPETQVFMVVNFHLAIQDEESLKRLNFSRDMIEGMGKNFIFLVTPYGDDRLATGAYDFYSFIKMRISFHNYEMEHEKGLDLLSVYEGEMDESEWESEEIKKKRAEADALMERAQVEYDRAHYAESEKLFLEARKIKGKLFGSDHLEMAVIYNELALAYEGQGRYKEAEDLYEKALSINENVLEKKHPSTAISYNNLAGVYVKQGKYREAEELFEKALRISKEILGEEHPSTAASYNNLAGVYKRQGRYKEAEELYGKALRVRKLVLGEEHLSTATSYNNLAGVYVEQGRYEEAEKLYEKALRIDKEILGERHPSTATGYNNLACMYEHQEKYREAEKLYGKTLRIWKEVLGEEHPDTQDVYKTLESLYYKRNPNGGFDQWLAEKMKD